MMGSGKSYWCKIIAQQLNLTTFDLDTVIETAANKSIAQIFEEQGEDFFRTTETESLHSFLNKDNCIVATGGGTPCFNSNMQWMNEHGLTIWLNEPVEVLAKRLVKEKAHRPLIKNLSDDELSGFLQQKLTERTPFYQQAKLHISSNQLSKVNLQQLISSKLS